MNKRDYELVEEMFNKYYENYKDLSSNIILKYRHSFNVANYMYDLADRLDMSDEDKYLAKTIGLLHDLGRFEQLKRFNSFDDKYLDHAEYAVDYLFNQNHIRDFVRVDTYDSIIKEAIANHSRYAICDGLNERELHFAEMIRDMDKLDIYFQVATMFSSKFLDKPTNIVVDTFFNGECVKNEDKKNKSDSVLIEFALLNDINFEETYEMLRETDNFGLYASSVEVSEENEELFNKMIERGYNIINRVI